MEIAFEGIVTVWSCDQLVAGVSRLPIMVDKSHYTTHGGSFAVGKESGSFLVMHFLPMLLTS